MPVIQAIDSDADTAMTIAWPFLVVGQGQDLELFVVHDVEMTLLTSDGQPRS